MQSPNISFRQSRLRLAYEKELYRSTKWNIYYCEEIWKSKLYDMQWLPTFIVHSLDMFMFLVLLMLVKQKTKWSLFHC